MQILHMNATYGRLQRAELRLEQGLNLIYAPNEAGKSTWSSFIRTMLYGLPTRVSGPLADKNRYAPWSGAAMQGSMELETDGERWSVLRDTRRANAPMQAFSCTYSGTAQPVPDITGQNLGQTLLGVPREIFQRSAFIGQSALRVDQDPELERRIAALLSSGQEEVSYSESYDRLKKQLNSHRHNKTGAIPRLEQELRRLDEALEQRESLADQAQAAQQQLEQAQQRLSELQQRQEQWALLEKQEVLRNYRKAQQQRDELRRQVSALETVSGHLPDQALISRLQGQADTLEQTRTALNQARSRSALAQQEAQRAQAALEAHPLYPATDAQLQQRAAALTPPAKPGPTRPLLAAGLLCAAIVSLLLLSGPLRIVAAAIGGCAALGLLLWQLLATRRHAQRLLILRQQQEELSQQAEAYAALRQRQQQTRAAADRESAATDELSRQQEQQLLALLGQVQRFWPEAQGHEGIRLALADAQRRRAALDEATTQLQNQEQRCQLLQQHLPQGPLPEPDESLPRPLISREQLSSALPQAAAQLREAQSRLDRLTGQLRALDSRDSLLAQRERRQAELTRQQMEYDSIALAMDTLDQANRILQSRFAPALGAETAEIFSALTGGRYDKVLLNRELELSAQLAGDPAAHSLSLLSQGAADQLYLAARLAICRLVLPAEHSAPLILDDALAYFDDRRLAAALDWLLQESRTRQILLFTCHRREQELLSGREGVHLVTLE